MSSKHNTDVITFQISKRSAIIAGVILVIITCIGIIITTSFKSSLFQSNEKEDTTPSKKTVKLGEKIKDQELIRAGYIGDPEQMKKYLNEIYLVQPEFSEMIKNETVRNIRYIYDLNVWLIETTTKGEERKIVLSLIQPFYELRHQYMVSSNYVSEITPEDGIGCIVTNTKFVSDEVNLSTNNLLEEGRLILTGDCSTTYGGGLTRNLVSIVNVENGQHIPITDPQNLVERKGKNLYNTVISPENNARGIITNQKYGAVDPVLVLHYSERSENPMEYLRGYAVVRIRTGEIIDLVVYDDYGS